MTAVMDQLAFQQATRATIPEMARFLQDLLGQRVTAAIAGVRDPKAVGEWARGERTPQPAAEQRLRAALRVAQLLLQVESKQTVRAWFVGCNPELEDAAPAEVLAFDPARVLQAARSFIASG